MEERFSFTGLFFFDFIQWKPTDTWPRDRCGRAQLVLLPSLADFLRPICRYHRVVESGLATVGYEAADRRAAGDAIDVSLVRLGVEGGVDAVDVDERVEGR